MPLSSSRNAWNQAISRRNSSAKGSAAALVGCLRTAFALATIASQSGRGQPHSKTLRDVRHVGERASVLECGCPLPLSPPQEVIAIVRRWTSCSAQQRRPVPERGTPGTRRPEGSFLVCPCHFALAVPASAVAAAIISMNQAGGRMGLRCRSMKAWTV